MIDFFSSISLVSGALSDAKDVLLAYLIIAVLYIILDLIYTFWLEQLKYWFPK